MDGTAASHFNNTVVLQGKFMTRSKLKRYYPTSFFSGASYRCWIITTRRAFIWHTTRQAFIWSWRNATRRAFTWSWRNTARRALFWRRINTARRFSSRWITTTLRVLFLSPDGLYSGDKETRPIGLWPTGLWCQVTVVADLRGTRPVLRSYWQQFWGVTGNSLVTFLWFTTIANVSVGTNVQLYISTLLLNNILIQHI